MERNVSVIFPAKLCQFLNIEAVLPDMNYTFYDVIDVFMTNSHNGIPQEARRNVSTVARTHLAPSPSARHLSYS